MVDQAPLKDLKVAGGRFALIRVSVGTVGEDDVGRIKMIIEAGYFRKHTRNWRVVHVSVEYERLGIVTPEVMKEMNRQSLRIA